ncbi:MAG: alpha/beta hydrolase-fold protein [Deinococcota bacterium]
MTRAAEDNNTDNSIVIGHKHTLYSEILGENRPYWVHLPYSYNDPPYARQHYPVVYLLDGDVNFHSFTGVTIFMGRGINYNFQIPEFIVVAIPHADRVRDLTPSHTMVGFNGKDAPFLESSGGGDTFLRFIEEELFPEITSTYPVQDYRVLVGHSFGGLLTLHALLTKPDMFHAHLAIDPSCWWDNEMLKRQAQQLLTAKTTLKSNVYISLAYSFYEGVDDPELNTTTMRAFVDVLTSFESPEFQLKFQYFDDEDHVSVPLLSWYYGFLHLFQGYKIDTDISKGSTYLKEHFDHWSKKLGIPRKPLEWHVNEAGLYFLHTAQDIDKALEFLTMNVANNPHSYNAHHRLAEAYEANGDTELAIAHYRKAMSLNPDLQDVHDQLYQLQKSLPGDTKKG